MIFDKRTVSEKRKTLDSKSGKRLSRLRIAVAIVLIIVFAGTSIIGVSSVYGIYRGILEVSPDIGTIDVSPKGFSTFVYDSKGNEIAKLVSTDSNRIPVDQTGISENLAHAFVAIEDERFYQHRGIDIPGIFRAIYVGLKGGLDFSEGASTITQQLIKNNVFTDWTNETTQDRVKRKIQEQFLAYQLEKSMPKSEILLNYLNTINLGHNTLGVEAASERYFNKPAKDLTLAECAVLAGITQNPTAYDPIVFPEDNKARQEVVLEHMLTQGYITQEEYQAALAEDVYATIASVNVDKEKVDNRVNSYFVDALIRQVIRDMQNEELNLVDDGEQWTEDKAYDMLSEAIELGKADNQYYIIGDFMKISTQKFKNDDTHREQLIQDYLTASEYINVIAENTQKSNSKQKEALLKAVATTKENVDAYFINSGAAECDQLNAIYAPKIEENKDNLEYLKK